MSLPREANPSSNAVAGRRADVPSPGAGSHPALVSFSQHQSASNGTAFFERLFAPLQTLGDVTNARTRSVDCTALPSGQTDSTPTSTAGAFEAGLHQPEIFARARKNGQRLHSDGEELVSTAAHAQPGPSPSLSASPEYCAVWEHLQASVNERPRGQRKRHVSASDSTGRGGAASGQAARLSSVR